MPIACEIASLRRSRSHPVRARVNACNAALRSGAKRSGAKTAPLAPLLLVALLTACATPEPAFEDVAPAEDLFAQGIEEVQGWNILGIYRWANYDKAIEKFQSIIDNYPYSDYAVKAELKIADAYFEDARYEESLSYYRDFADLHPTHEQVPFAVFRSAQCHHRQVRSTNRDQAPTREAIAFLDRLLVTYPHSPYAEEAEPLWRELQIHLAESVEGVADFYRGREEFEAAAERYRLLLNEYPGLGLDDRVLFKLAECYDELNRVDESDRILRTIVAHYGDGRYAYLAKQKIAASLE